MGSSALFNNSLVGKFRRPLGVARRYLRSLAFRTRRQRDELLRDASLQPQERAWLQQVETRISRHDGMYKGDGRHYYSVGLSAIRCVEQAFAAAQLAEVKTALDMPCGHGRVLRFLVQRFSQTRFTACDLDRDGVDFCARMFGAVPAYSQSDLGRLSLGKQFDLIWCGSLVTHLDDRKAPALFDFFRRHLLPGGLVIFTAAGDRVGEWMLNQQFDYGIARESIPLITESYRETGHGYTDYPYLSDYGISLTSPAWIRSQVEAIGGLVEVYFQAHGWDDHQDVFGFVRQTTA